MVAPERPLDASPADAMLDQIYHLQSTFDRTAATLPSGYDASRGWKDPTFDPKIHIAKEKPCDVYTFANIRITQPDSASSHIAGTTPFPLFTPEAIPAIRRALFNPAYIHKTACIFNHKTLILRNTAAFSPFFRRLWTHPEVLRRLSEAAGVQLEPVMETMELGHANVQVDFSQYEEEFPDNHDKLEQIAQDMTDSKSCNLPENINFTDHVPKQRDIGEVQKELEHALMPWHYDSYPWVCVVMVSVTDTMTGGETVIRRGDGGIEAISQPGMGSAIMLQGGLVKHLALPSKSEAGDRITIITSFRPASPKILDSSFMSNIRPYTELHPLYRQWMAYRLSRLAPTLQRIHDTRRFLVVPDEKDYEELNEAMAEAREYAKRTLRQMVSPHIVARIAKKYGTKLFFTIRDDYVANRTGPFNDCPQCDFHFPDPRWDALDDVVYCRFCKEVTGDGMVVVDKKHVNECSGARQWKAKNDIWGDVEETRRVLEVKGMEYRVRMRELQVRDVVENWEMEKREWGIADELACQGLNEYLIEYLEWWGFELH